MIGYKCHQFKTVFEINIKSVHDKPFIRRIMMVINAKNPTIIISKCLKKLTSVSSDDALL